MSSLDWKKIDDHQRPIDPNLPLQGHIVQPDLFLAICLWEGRGKVDCEAVGDKDTPFPAIGPAQIRQPYLEDANKQLEREGHPIYTLEEMKDYDKAKVVFDAYMRRYFVTGLEDRARCHNGGPMGCRKACTRKYWTGVRSYLGKKIERTLPWKPTPSSQL